MTNSSGVFDDHTALLFLTPGSPERPGRPRHANLRGNERFKVSYSSMWDFVMPWRLGQSCSLANVASKPRAFSKVLIDPARQLLLDRSEMRKHFADFLIVKLANSL